MPELERPNNTLDYFFDKHSVTVCKEKSLTTVGQLKKHMSLDNAYNNDTVINSRKGVLLNSGVVVDHLSASWTLVIINCVVNFITL